MRREGTWFLWLLALFCLALCLVQGVFSLSGFMGLVVGVLALPVPLVRFLWTKILPPGSPRIAKGSLLVAAFVVMIAAAASEMSDKKVLVRPAPTQTPAPAGDSAAVPGEEAWAGIELPSPQEEEAPVPAVSQATETPEVPPEESIVYVAGSGSGTKYHKDPTCSGMQEAVSLTRVQAEQQGYTPCKRCYG